MLETPASYSRAGSQHQGNPTSLAGPYIFSRARGAAQVRPNTQVKFDGTGSPPLLEHPDTEVAKPAARTALSLLCERDGGRHVPQWRHWVVGVEPTGRITLPPGARQVLGSESSAQAVSRGGMLVLHRGGVGASLPIDGRGRLILPAWLRGAARSSGSVLVAARAASTPAVVLATTDLLEDLVSHVAADAQ